MRHSQKWSSQGSVQPRSLESSPQQQPRISLGLSRWGLAGVLGLFPAFLPGVAQAQIPVVGGDLSFSNTEIFVPNPACGCNPGSSRPAEFTGVNSTPSRFFIQTAQGNTVLNAVFRTDVNPFLSTAPGTVPGAGDVTLGALAGSLSFRGFTASGEPAFYNDIPTELNFQITGGTFTELRESDRYTTDSLLFTRTGVISNPGAVVTDTRPVVLIQFPNLGRNPSDRTINGIDVDGDLFDNFEGSGKIFSSTFDAKITGGEVLTPTLPDFSFEPPLTPVPITDANRTGETPPSILTVPIFILPVTTVLPTIGDTQTDPVMPMNPGTTLISVGIFVFDVVPSDLWFDPPAAEAFDFTMKPSPQRVGVGSRVFPGLGGTREETSTFTAITGLPKGIDKDEKFTVSVKGVTLGEFTSDQTVNFSDYREKLGALLKDGGVESFTVSGIDGAVDPRNPRAFPIRLRFNNPTASFEMKAQGVQTSSSKVAPIARLMQSPPNS